MKINAICTFDGQTIKSDGVVQLKFRIPASYITNAIRTVILIDSKFKLSIVAKGARYRIGLVIFKKLSIDSEGESKLTLETTLDELLIDLNMLKALINITLKIRLRNNKANE